MKLIYCLLFLIPIISCDSKQKFNKAGWSKVEDLMSFPERDAMVDDLKNSYQLKGKSFSEIITLLGQPQYTSNTYFEIGYKIKEDYEQDLDPVYTKTFIVEFTKDSLVNNYGIKEWKK